MKKPFPWFEVILIVVFMGIQIYAALSDGTNFPNTWFSRDDAYYYFKVAQNISEGRGSTFDGIHSTNGYHPLWLLINIPIFALARFDLILPLRVLLIVMSALTAVTAVLIYRILKEALSTPAAMLAAIYWVFDFYVQIVFYRSGLESGIALFFIVLLLHQLFSMEKTWRKTEPSLKQIAALGVIAILATLSRLDLIFFSVIIGIWVVFRKSPIRYLLPLDILVIFISALGAYIWRLGFPGYYSAVTPATATVIVSLIVSIPVFYFFGLYQRPSAWTGAGILQHTALAGLASSGLASAFLLILNGLQILAFSPYILAANAALNFAGILLSRLAVYAIGNKSERTELIHPIQHFRNNWLTWLKESSVYYGILGGALSLYMIWNKIFFGTFTPVSGQIKRWWASPTIYGSQSNSLLAFLGLNPDAEFSAWQPLSTYINQWYKLIAPDRHGADPLSLTEKVFPITVLLIFILIVALILTKRRKTIRNIAQIALIPLFAGSWVQILSYSTTGYASPKEWYWLTEQILLLFAAVMLIDCIYKLVSKHWIIARVAMWTLITLYAMSSAIRYYQDVSVRMAYGYSNPNGPYMDVVPFLEGLTRPGDIIGMTGGGNVGYFLGDRTVVNMDGLINSYDYFQALKSGASADYLYDSGMRFVFANPEIIDSGPYRGQYAGRLQSIMDWGGKDLMRLLPKPAP